MIIPLSFSNTDQQSSEAYTSQKDSHLLSRVTGTTLVLRVIQLLLLDLLLWRTGKTPSVTRFINLELPGVVSVLRQSPGATSAVAEGELTSTTRAVVLDILVPKVGAFFGIDLEAGVFNV